jgi:hypothetical protein
MDPNWTRIAASRVVGDMGLTPTTENVLTWLGIALCIAQSGMFAGLNLAVFSLSRLRLEIEANAGNEDAVAVRELRRDSNLTLTTIVWGSVATNVLLTLLSDSVLSGLAAFAFSTVAITFLGEIVPQAYFSRAEMGDHHQRGGPAGARARRRPFPARRAVRRDVGQPRDLLAPADHRD